MAAVLCQRISEAARVGSVVVELGTDISWWGSAGARLRSGGKLSGNPPVGGGAFVQLATSHRGGDAAETATKARAKQAAGVGGCIGWQRPEGVAGRVGLATVQEVRKVAALAKVRLDDDADVASVGLS